MPSIRACGAPVRGGSAAGGGVRRLGGCDLAGFHELFEAAQITLGLDARILMEHAGQQAAD